MAEQGRLDGDGDAGLQHQCRRGGDARKLEQKHEQHRNGSNGNDQRRQQTLLHGRSVVKGGKNGIGRRKAALQRTGAKQHSALIRIGVAALAAVIDGEGRLVEHLLDTGGADLFAVKPVGNRAGGTVFQHFPRRGLEGLTAGLGQRYPDAVDGIDGRAFIGQLAAADHGAVGNDRFAHAGRLTVAVGLVADTDLQLAGLNQQLGETGQHRSARRFKRAGDDKTRTIGGSTDVKIRIAERRQPVRHDIFGIFQRSGAGVGRLENDDAAVVEVAVIDHLSGAAHDGRRNLAVGGVDAEERHAHKRGDKNK